MKISIIICAHNPQRDYLNQMLVALKSQTLPLEQWELLLVDNASDRALASEIDLSWHPQSCHLYEEKLGLTHARLRGIQAAIGEVLIFVDDDNVLADDYLEVALRISQDYPMIGAWGGQIDPEFEATPPDWIEPYLPLLAIRQLDRDCWSNFAYHDGSSPCGAGLCIRKVIAEYYAELIQKNARRAMLGRKGTLLTSCEDSDLAFTACDLGFGKGIFTALKLKHLIPPQRLQERYLLKLAEGIGCSETILAAFRGRFPSRTSVAMQIVEFYHRLRLSPRERRFYDAKRSGERFARQKIKHWNSSDIA